MREHDRRSVLFRWWRRVTAAANRLPKPPGVTEPIIRLPATHQAAAQALRDPVKVKAEAYLRKCDKTRLGNPDPHVCHPLLREFWEELVKALQKRQYPCYAHNALRTFAEQNNLFNKGVSKARGGQSPHNFGMAVDIVYFNREWKLTHKEWAVIGLVGKEVARRRNIKITWGGDWDFYDPAHWQLADWKERARKGEGTRA